jgi:hypothetical protein
LEIGIEREFIRGTARRELSDRRACVRFSRSASLYGNYAALEQTARVLLLVDAQRARCKVAPRASLTKLPSSARDCTSSRNAKNATYK